MRGRPVLLLAAACLHVLAVGCVHRSSSWTLVEPPAVQNPAYPKGYQLVLDAPEGDWLPVAAFASETACEAAKKRLVDDAVDRARAASGAAAKYELPVRRAVHARCLRGAGR